MNSTLVKIGTKRRFAWLKARACFRINFSRILTKTDCQHAFDCEWNCSKWSDIPKTKGQREYQKICWPPKEYERCLVGITSILRETWNTSKQTEDNREKMHVLILVKECYSMKLDILTNATVVDDTITINEKINLTKRFWI